MVPVLAIGWEVISAVGQDWSFQFKTGNSIVAICFGEFEGNETQ